MAFTANTPINVRLGKVAIYTAATAQADPLDIAMPTGGWTYMGWMAAATMVLATVGVLEIVVDDLVVAIDTVINNRAAGVDGAFAEFDLNVLAQVWGGTLSSVAASTNHNGYDLITLKGADDIVHKACVVEQIDPREIAAGTALPVGRTRIWAPNTSIGPNGNIEWSRKREAGIPFSARFHPNTDGSNLISRTYKFTSVGV